MTRTKGSDHYWRDWSRWNSLTSAYDYVPIMFDIAIKNGALFSFIKTCDGKSLQRFSLDMLRDGRLVGQRIAPYCWLYNSSMYSINGQADFWYSVHKDEPVIAIDFEETPIYVYDKEKGELVVDHYEYAEASDLYGVTKRLIELGYKGKIVIYTRTDYWQTHGNTDDYWLQFYLWLARYSTYEPIVPSPWSKYGIKYKVWQKGASGNPESYGVVSGKLSIDEDEFNGTIEELNDFFGGVIIPEPPNGGNVATYKGTVLVGLYVRSCPAKTCLSVGGLMAGYKVEADKKENGWWHLTSVNGIPTTAESWSYEGASQEFIRTDEVVNPPSTTLPILHMTAGADGYETKAFDLNPLP